MIRVSLFLIGLLLWAGRRVLYAWWLRLPLPRYVVRVERGLRVTAADGTLLVTDHYAPLGVEDAPTILVRSPYGRNHEENLYSSTVEWFVQRFAERGYHVVVQDCRGRFDSGGTFEPFVNEVDDGLATAEWLRRQSWFNGRLGTWGPSYLGVVQWAIADKVPELRAMVPIFTASRIEPVIFPAGTLNYGLTARWIAIIALLDEYAARGQSRWRSALLPFEASRRSEKAFRRLPLHEAIMELTDENHPFRNLREAFLDQDSDLWQRARYLTDPEQVRVPAFLVAGWFDIFLREQLRDYQILKANGQQPHLVIGPWMHFNQLNGMQIGVTTAMRWFDHHLKGKPLPDDAPVQVFVMGSNEWRALPDFPPPAREERLYLHEDRLLDEVPAERMTRSYRYDPLRPTPAFGGIQFTTDLKPIKDNRRHEKRRDVLYFTSLPLIADTEIIGSARLNLYMRSTCPTADFFARICDVYPDGRSINIADGYVRVANGADQDTQCVEIEFAPTACRFVAGHRLRLIVASGAYPNTMRNFGTLESPIKAESGVTADQTIFCGGETASCLSLPVVTAS